ncbi:hypothetical protein E3A20_16120, partial [Planctomyces bekefii]
TAAGPVPESLLKRVAGDFSIQLVFVDGQLSLAHSKLASCPKGVRILPAAESLDTCPEWHQQENRSAISKSVFAQLNRAFTGASGAIIQVDDGVQLAAPISLVHVTTEDRQDHVLLPRHMVKLGAGASAQMV